MIPSAKRPTAEEPVRQGTKVLYIGGYMRTGSTLLGRLLGQLDGWFCTGELRRIWEESFAQDQPCGCGAPFKECDFWRDVITEAYGGFDGVDMERIRHLKLHVDRMRYIPHLVSPWKGAAYGKSLAEYAAILDRLYAGVQKVTRSRVIVDSSKDASYAYTLANLPGVDFYAVHLVRDSRAVAYSWLRKKVKHETPTGETVYMPQITPAASAAGWMRANLLFEPLRLRVRYLTVRYEDLLDAPALVVGRILALVGEDQGGVSLEDRTVALGTDHSVAGNPMRFTTGEIPLRLDRQWEDAMSAADRRLVTTMTMPLLLRYGYLRHRKGAERCVSP